MSSANRVDATGRGAPGNAEPPPDSAAAFYEWAFRNSSCMRSVKQVIDRVAATDVTVLIWGESGVGKEIVARALLEQSPRRDRPFVKVNCAALPLELLESELFGHEIGAFTGAYRQKPGKFELANTGTVFLDEIGEMPLALQAKLLQVLQDREFSRLGSRKDIRVDVRIIAATNKELRLLLDQGAFRRDLYYRLNVVNIHVPPLRERREEIPVLVDYFLSKYAEQYARARPRLSPETMTRFMAYHWPGNVRELENTIKRITVLESDEWVPQALAGTPRAAEPTPPATHAAGEGERPLSFDLDGGLRDIARRAAEHAEKIAIQYVLDRVHWHRLEAARRLKVSYKTLLTKMKQHGLGGLLAALLARALLS
jgi:two-component system response regulator AtoC